jgi:hypothetical protein
MFRNYEKIKVWAKDGFRLSLYDPNRRDHLGKNVLAYRFTDHGKLIFQGEDFACSPLHSVDSLETVYSLLTFLSLRSGDTDEEYFADYTPEQIEWRDSRAETLSMLVYDGESRLEKRRH